MSYRVPESAEEWMRQVEKRIITQERRAGTELTGSFVPVPSDADQASLVSWYRPTARKPLMIDRVDTLSRPDLRYTKDGVTWWSLGGATRIAPPWSTPTLLNGWYAYGSGYAAPRYLKTGAGIVVLSGLLRNNGTPAAGSVIFTLPPGYRPDSRLTFAAWGDPGKMSRLGIMPNGDVLSSPSTSFGYQSLDGIAFPAADPTRVWTRPTLLNGFTDYNLGDPTYPPVGMWKDSNGGVWFQGLVTRPGGAIGTDIAIFDLPVGYRASSYMHGFGPATGETFAPLGNTATQITAKTGANPTSWMGLSNMRYVATTAEAAYTQLTLSAPWANLGGGWPMASAIVTADSRVYLHGLISGGAATSSPIVSAMPVGWRAYPDGYQITTVNHGGAAGRVDVMTAVTWSGTANNYVSLDGPMYIAGA